MPLDADDQKRVDRAKAEVGADDGGTRLLVLNVSQAQKLGFWTIFCTVLNRAIGSGIFVTPAILLKATGSPGASLLLWSLGAVAGMCALLIWLEFGLSIPKFWVPNRYADDSLAEGESLQCIPRSGGEKNYLEYVYGSTRLKKLRTSCMYGLIYITMGNLSGNTIAFGIYVLEAAGVDGGDHSLIRGLAVVCMTATCLIHMTYRQGGIYFIILMAIFKVCILLAIIVIGFAAMAGREFGYGPVHGQTILDRAAQSGPSNLATHSSFKFATKDFASYANSLLYVVYTFSGNEQPFYVLSEVVQPRKVFPKAMISAVSSIIVLFMLVHIAFLGVVSYDPTLSIQCLSIKDSVNKFDGALITDAINDENLLRGKCSLDMATVFFGAIFGGEVAKRVMSGIIAASTFGNILTMTFTASRVKQEIAKEGILPFSFFFARSIVTPWALLRQRFWKQKDYEPERSPTPALLLHWIFSMILIGATSAKTPDVAYSILILLYAYNIVVIIGFFTASGLLWIRFFGEEGEWTQRSGFRPWGGPTAAIIYAAISLFLLIASFIPPKRGSPFLTEVRWFIIPTVSLGFLVLGYCYYLGLTYVVPGWFMKGKTLVADREAVIIREKGEYVQALEIVDASWVLGPDERYDVGMELPRVNLVN